MKGFGTAPAIDVDASTKAREGIHVITRGIVEHAALRALADDRVIAVFQNTQGLLGDYGDLPATATEPHAPPADALQTPVNADRADGAGRQRSAGRRNCV